MRPCARRRPPSAGRSAFCADLQGPKFRVGEIGGGSAALTEGATFRFDTTESAGSADRVFLPHPADLRGRRARPHAAARRRQDPHDGDGEERHAHRRHGAGRRHALEPQGHQPARYRAADRAAHREGQEGPRLRAAARRRLGGAVVRAARRGHAAGAPDRRPGRGADGQDREAGGDRRSRCDRGCLRRPDGGARRSRRRDAGGARAGPAEADRQQGARRRQAGGGGHADAGEHDHLAGADAGGGVGRGHRRVRRRRCHHAVGGVGGGQVPDRGDPHDGPHRQRGAERSQLQRHRARDAHAAAGDGGRRHRGRRPHGGRHAASSPPSSATRRRARPRSGWRASGPACPSSACRRWWRRGAGWPWCGACTAC